MSPSGLTNSIIGDDMKKMIDVHERNIIQYSGVTEFTEDMREFPIKVSVEIYTEVKNPTKIYEGIDRLIQFLFNTLKW